MKKLIKSDINLRGALPADIFSDQDKTKNTLIKMIQRTADEMMTDDAMQKAIWKWKSRFLFRR